MSEVAGEHWRPIETAPKDVEILVYTKPWGAIIASLSEEYGEWLSRMQVPVSIRDEEEMPTHWQPLPAPPVVVDEAALEYGPVTPEFAGR